MTIATGQAFYDRVMVKTRRSQDPNLRLVIVDEFTEMIDEFEHSPFMPWFLETTSTGLTMQTGSLNATGLTSDYLLLVEDSKVRFSNAGTWTSLQRMWQEDLTEKYENAAAGPPEVYDIFGGQIWFGPKPDQNYVYRMKYYAKSSLVPDDSTPISHKWIINAQGLCVASLAQRLVSDYVKDPKTAGELQSEVDRIYNALVKYNESRKHVDMDYAVDR